MAKLSKNCVYCLFGLIFNFASPVGITWYTLQCDHTKNRKNKIKFEKKHVCTTILTWSFLLYATFACIKEIKTALDSKEDLFEIIFLIPQFIICAGILLCLLSVLLQANTISAMIRRGQKILNYSENRLETPLPLQVLQKFRTMQCVGLILISVVVCAVAAIYFGFAVPISHIDRMAQLICFYVACVLFLLLTFVNIFCKYLFNYYDSSLRSELECRLRKKGHKRYTTSLIEMLKNSKMLYVEVLRLLNDYRKVLNPALFLWLLTTVTVYICVTYLVIITLFDENRSIFNTKLVGIEIVFLLGVIFFVGYVYEIADLQNMSKNLMSYLYKFPISKLTRDEANEVESVISTITKHKVVFTVSNCFSLTLSIFACMFGTTVTYVLTIIQLQILFSKN